MGIITKSSTAVDDEIDTSWKFDIHGEKPSKYVKATGSEKAISRDLYSVKNDQKEKTKTSAMGNITTQKNNISLTWKRRPKNKVKAPTISMALNHNKGDVLFIFLLSISTCPSELVASMRLFLPPIT